jgi:hypothetical protein
MLTRSQTKNSSIVSNSNNKVFSNSRMVTRSQINMTIEEVEDEVKVHRPTNNNRKIIVDVDECAPRMVTRSMTLANQVKQEIDFDGASRAWRKANPNRHR